MSASATPPDSATAPMPPVVSNAQLGQLLASALEEVEQLKSQRDTALSRATRAESLASGSPSAKESSTADVGHASADALASSQALIEQQQRTIAELSQRLKGVTEAYNTFERLFASFDGKAHEARLNLSKAFRHFTTSSGHPSPQLPHSDTSAFQPSLSRKSSRTTTLPPPPSPASHYHPHHSHQQQQQQQQGSHHHPSLQIPPGAPGGRSTVSAGVPANLPPVPIAGRVRLREDSLPRRQSDESPIPRHRLSADDAVDLAPDDGERRAKRFRSEAQAVPSRRDRTRTTDSPRSSVAGISPQFTFPPPSTSGPGYVYPQLQITDRFSNANPSPSSASSVRRQFSDGTSGTLHSAITPTSAATSASRSSIGSRSYAPARMDSIEEAPPTMMGGQRMESPPPMPRKEEGGEELSREDEEEKISVDELIHRAIDTDGPQPPISAVGEGEMERDELEPDAMLSPRSSIPHIHHHRRGSEAEKWKERDRQREAERSSQGHPQDYSKRSPTSANVDRFRHYSIPPVNNSPGPHPYAHPPERDRPPRTGSPPHQHMYPPMTATFSLNQQTGQLQATGRRGTIAGLVAPQRSHTDGERERSSFSAFEGSHRRTYSGGGSGDFTGGSSGKGSPVINFFGTPQQPGQQRHTGPGPAVKPTLNAQGQRTCRQCAQPGRYKDGKCVEKWGPGPAGPGTVCDRCRKKMKRVERRGTQEAASLAQGVVALNQMHHQTQAQSPQQSPGQQYYNNPPYRPTAHSPSDPQREYQFQTPLSASSNNWSAGSRRDSSTWPMTAQYSPQDRDRGRPEHRSQKRRAPEYSESPSPPPSSRKDSGSVEEPMESAAEHLMAEAERPRPSGKEKPEADDDREPDAEGDDAEGEDAVGEEVEDQEVGSVAPPAQPSPSPLPTLAKPEHPPLPTHPVSPPQSPSADAKPPSWAKLEENGVLVSTH